MNSVQNLPAQRSKRRLATTVAGVVAAALTGPLLAFVPADAHSDRTWGRLAECESGRRWHLNTGNGYYGGLQFSNPTWRGFGGGKFAPRADLATRRQQIRIAEKVQNQQGWGAWPYCSQKLGL